MHGRSYSAAFRQLRHRQALRGNHIQAPRHGSEDWAAAHRAARIEARIDAVRHRQVRRMGPPRPM